MLSYSDFRIVLKHFEPGDIIARQGDLCKGLYILASGSVRAGMINDEGKELTVEIVLFNRDWIYLI